jgi:hypothetical protein
MFFLFAISPVLHPLLSCLLGNFLTGYTDIIVFLDSSISSSGLNQWYTPDLSPSLRPFDTTSSVNYFVVPNPPEPHTQPPATLAPRVKVAHFYPDDAPYINRKENDQSRIFIIWVGQVQDSRPEHKEELVDAILHILNCTGRVYEPERGYRSQPRKDTLNAIFRTKSKAEGVMRKFIILPILSILTFGSGKTGALKSIC